MPEVIPPALEFVSRFRIDLVAPIDLGTTPSGHERIVPIGGGIAEGPRLSGTVLNAGADFQILRTDTLTELDARYAIETHDGALIAVRNRGVRTGGREDMLRLAAGEPVPAGRLYFRTTPRLSSSDPRYDWVNLSIFVGVAERLPDAVIVDVFRVS